MLTVFTRLARLKVRSYIYNNDPTRSRGKRKTMILRDDYDVCGAFSLQLRTASTLQLTARDGSQMCPL